MNPDLTALPCGFLSQSSNYCKKAQTTDRFSRHTLTSFTELSLFVDKSLPVLFSICFLRTCQAALSLHFNPEVEHP